MHVNQDSSVSLRNLSFHETAMLKVANGGGASKKETRKYGLRAGIT